MSTPTLSQRLRELRKHLVTEGYNVWCHDINLLDGCIAQAEAQEAKAIGEQTPVDEAALRGDRPPTISRNRHPRAIH